MFTAWSGLHSRHRALLRFGPNRESLEFGGAKGVKFSSGNDVHILCHATKNVNSSCNVVVLGALFGNVLNEAFIRRKLFCLCEVDFMNLNVKSQM